MERTSLSDLSWLLSYDLDVSVLVESSVCRIRALRGAAPAVKKDRLLGSKPQSIESCTWLIPVHVFCRRLFGSADRIQVCGVVDCLPTS